MRFTVTSWPRFIFFILMGLVLLALVAWGIIFAFRLSPPNVAEIPELPSSVQPTQLAAEPLTALIVQVDSKREQRRLVSCREKHCETRSIPVPQAEAVTDGENWYYYAEKADPKDKEKTIRTLIRRFPDGSEQTLIEQTPLVRPHGLHLSPDNRKIAFWLDNIADPKAELTELWVYEHESQGTRLLAEKIHQPDVLTNPRWNSASTHLAFIADNSSDKSEDAAKIELVTISLQPATVAAKFTRVDWATRQELFDSSVLDIRYTADAIALVEAQENGTSKLSVIAEGSDAKDENKVVPGEVPYVRWLQDGTLLYIVAGEQDFSMWRLQGNTHRFVARQPGTFRSALTAGNEDTLLIAAEENKKPRLISLHLSSGSISEEGNIPAFGEGLHIVQVDRNITELAVAGTSSRLADDELIAFIERHQAEISKHSEAKAVRIVTTVTANTAYFDYRLAGSPEQRLLLVVRDAIYPEWEVIARYQRLAGDWAFLEGNRDQKPAPARIYEWEDPPGQWVLKQEFAENYLQIESAL